MAKTYTIERSNGDSRTAASMNAALATARQMLGVLYIYRGAEYQTDRPGKDGEREYCTCLDIWRSRASAEQETDGPADVVISWAARRATTPGKVRGCEPPQADKEAHS